jgi:beta-mannosidase
MKIDLSKMSWQVQGWRPYAWQLKEAFGGGDFYPDTPAVPARVPGSVQAALRDSGVIPDWNKGLHSLDCEWVEHRHWEFFTELEVAATSGDPIILHADGLDYSGWIVIDHKVVEPFSGALIRHRLDLSRALGDGKKHRFAIIFDIPPEEQGQAGYTMRSRYFKARYNFSWDWCPRFVPIGIWDDIHLSVGPVYAQAVRIRTSVADNLQQGEVMVLLETGAATRQVHLTLNLEGNRAAAKSQAVSPGENTIRLPVAEIRLWWPNGQGAQTRYDLTIEAEDAAGRRHLLKSAEVGFKKVAWLPCEGAPPDARPWICEINGRPIFLQGFNWVPLSVDYHFADVEDYIRLINFYRDAGCNILRVWGGAIVEREIFYRLCDQAGLLVWQEFPMASSGIENWPPSDPAAIADFTAIARDYIRRRGHHVSKLLWCGGNEMQSEFKDRPGGNGIPIDESNPCIAAVAKIVAEEDPGVRFLPVSASGPAFMADPKNFGKGLHHDVHGPWKVIGPMSDWEKYWTEDDALFRSEVGTPAAASIAFLEKYADGLELWPPNQENRFWMHTSGWWLQYDEFKATLAGLEPKAWLQRYVEESARLQAHALAFAARRTRDRFPRCGGFMVWMGHDAFPCAVSIAVIDYDREPRPALHALAEVFKSKI